MTKSVLENYEDG